MELPFRPYDREFAVPFETPQESNFDCIPLDYVPTVLSPQNIFMFLRDELPDFPSLEGVSLTSRYLYDKHPLISPNSWDIGHYAGNTAFFIKWSTLIEHGEFLSVGLGQDSIPGIRFVTDVVRFVLTAEPRLYPGLEKCDFKERRWPIYSSKKGHWLCNTERCAIEIYPDHTIPSDLFCAIGFLDAQPKRQFATQPEERLPIESTNPAKLVFAHLMATRMKHVVPLLERNPRFLEALDKADISTDEQKTYQRRAKLKAFAEKVLNDILRDFKDVEFSQTEKNDSGAIPVGQVLSSYAGGDAAKARTLASQYQSPSAFAQALLGEVNALLDTTFALEETTKRLHPFGWHFNSPSD